MQKPFLVRSACGTTLTHRVWRWLRTRTKSSTSHTPSKVRGTFLVIDVNLYHYQARIQGIFPRDGWVEFEEHIYILGYIYVCQGALTYFWYFLKFKIFKGRCPIQPFPPLDPSMNNDLMKINYEYWFRVFLVYSVYCFTITACSVHYVDSCCLMLDLDSIA